MNKGISRDAFSLSNIIKVIIWSESEYMNAYIIFRNTNKVQDKKFII